jgi:hypothetical protein
MRTTISIAAVIAFFAFNPAFADVDLIRVDFDAEACPVSVENDEDSCPQPAPGRACRRAGQPIIWQAAPGSNRAQFTIEPKGANPIVGCSMTSTPGGVLNCRISTDVAVDESYEYGISNAATGCALDPQIFIIR